MAQARSKRSLRRLVWVVTALLGCSGAQDQGVAAPAEPSRTEPVEPPVRAASSGDRRAEIPWDGSFEPMADDAELLRRLFLDLLGRIPLEEEVRRFSEGAASEWPRIVDRVLSGPELTAYWADVLYDRFVPARHQRKKYFDAAAREWLRAALSKRKGYDAIVREIIAAEGTVSEHGAAAFIAANRTAGSTELLTVAVATTFLGAPEYACAQCHDHPYDPRFTQRDFYGLTAYFARTRVAQPKNSDEVTLEVREAEEGELRAKLAGHAKAEVVAPAFPWANDSVQEVDGSRRKALAEMMLRSGLVAEAAVDLIWMRLIGRPFAPDERLLRSALAQDFEANGYELRSLLRTIVLSPVYVQARRNGGGRRARTLDHRQLFNSIRAATSIRGTYPWLESESWKSLRLAYRELSEGVENPELEDQGLSHVLFLLNRNVVNEAVRALPGSRLRSILETHEGFESRLEALFLGAYSRLPEKNEVEGLRELFEEAEHESAAWEDLLFSMLTSTEFRTY